MTDSTVPKTHHSATITFRPDIEGLRAIAILLVVLYHGGFGVNGGYVGVDVFFVLSGYLITLLLTQEFERERSINLLAFFAKRIRRLVPAMGVLIVAVLIASIILMAPFEQRATANTAISTALYLSNLFFAHQATDYLSGAEKNNPLLHTWSLGVEEQFYIFWPMFVFFIFLLSKNSGEKKRNRQLVISFSAIFGISFLANIYFTYSFQPFAFFLPFSRAWEFSIGAVFVFVPRVLSNIISHGSGLAWKMVAWASLALLLWCGFVYDEGLAFPGFYALLPAMTTGLILLAGERSVSEVAPLKILGIWPLQYIGKISYSLYLWHWPVFVFLRMINHNPDTQERVFALAVSFALAHLSYQVIEKPIRFHSLLSQSRGYTYIVGLGIAAVALTSGILVRSTSATWSMKDDQKKYQAVQLEIPTIYSDKCHAGFFDTSIDSEKCTYGATSSGTTVMLIGDSHAAQWFPALEAIAIESNWELVALTKSACPVVIGAYYYERLNREYVECATWRKEIIGYVKQRKPKILVLSAYFGYYNVTGREFKIGVAATLELLSRAADTVIVIQDTPDPVMHVPNCLARRSWRKWFNLEDPCNDIESNGRSLARYGDLEEIARRFPNVQAVDLNSAFCPEGVC